MAARVQRVSPALILGFAVLAGVAGGAAAAPRVHGLDPLAVIVVAVAAASLLVTCLAMVEPAWILTGGLLLSVFSGNWGNMGVPIPLDRLAIVGGIAAALIRSWSSSERDERIQLRSVHWLMLLLVLYAIGSAAWSGTLTSHGPLFALLDRLGLVPFLLYLIAPVAFRTDSQRRVLAGGLMALGGYLGLITLFEAVHATSLVIPHYIMNPAIGLHAERGRGPFLEAGANGLAMFVCAVAAFISASSTRKRWVRIAAATVIALCAAGILFTLTRQTWIAAGAGAGAAMLADHRLRGWLPLGALAVAAVVAVSLAFVPGLSHSVSQRTADQTPVWDRLNSDAAALRMVQARPGLGFGWGRFGAASGPYYRLAGTYPLTSVGTAHNMTLSNASELGLAGVAVWLAIMAIAIVLPAGRRVDHDIEPWRIGLIAVAIAWFVQSNFTPLDYAFDNYVVWLWAGIVTIGSSRYSPYTSYSRRAFARRSNSDATNILPA